MNFEILAPAGSPEALIAGVRSGANAIYLGGKAFNARSNAGNFDDEELKNAVKYCHQRNVRVYLTVNTLVDDSEIPRAYNLIKFALSIGVDAFIVQDLGLAKLIHKHFPKARLHASTQTSVMSVEGVLALQKIGFSRVVLPREMNLDEIKEISKSTNVELEIFVHGALCMSVSGQCYLSAMLGSRSGNRGKCAQPCRLPFSADNSGSCDLSLKDLSIIENLKELYGTNVVSLKIEGRMKRPEFIAAAVNSCKKGILGKYDITDKIKLKSVFSRSGFTNGYLMGKTGAEMFGTRLKEDVVSAKSVLNDFSHLYDNENPLIPVDIYMTCEENEPISISMKALGKAVFVKLDIIPEKAVNKPLNEEILVSRLSKLGSTPFFAKNVEVSLNSGITVRASAINELRRTATEQLLEKLSDFEPVLEVEPFIPKSQIKDNKTPYFTARFKNVCQIPKNHPFKRIFLPIWINDNDFIKYNSGVEIPRGLFSKEKEIEKRLIALKKAGVKNALCPNLGALTLAKKLGFNVYGDFGLNIFNSYNNQVESSILSFELTLEQISKIQLVGEKGIIGYGKLPLMLTRNCPIKQKIGCEKCEKKGVLTDRKGIKFPVICSNYPCVEILNSVPVYMADRLNEINTDFIDFYFTNETMEEIASIIESYNKKLKPTIDFTRGLYYRGVE